MTRRKFDYKKSAREWPEPVASKLISDEEERIKRAKTRVRFCPACGRKPEYPPDNVGRHIYSLRCEKCPNQPAFVIHVNEIVL